VFNKAHKIDGSPIPKSVRSNWDFTLGIPPTVVGIFSTVNQEGGELHVVQSLEEISA